ncbi:MAG: transporter substrate-binding domain-containing protein [Alphaproteobacteria bacterium]|nr:transporter substrate-binding domain-containing protein [Alphaproteobacteria bacterium]
MKFLKISLMVLSVFLFSNISYAKKTKNEYVEAEKQVVVKHKKVCNMDCGCRRPIRVAGFVTNPPFGWATSIEYKGKNKYITNGYGIDLFFKMAEELDLRTENVGYSSYQTALRELRRGNIDVIAGVYYNKNNLGVGMDLLFPSFMNNPILPIYLKGKEKNIQTFADLKGLKGVVRQEEMIYPIVYRQLLPGTSLEQVSGSKRAFKMLLEGKVDYMLTSLYSAEAEIRRFKLVDKIQFSTKALVKPELFFVFSATSGCQGLKNAFTQKLRMLQADKGAYEKNFIGYIDQWGQAFKDEPGLLDVSPTKQESETAKDMEKLLKTDKNEVSDKDLEAQKNNQE